jgi:hypothetical protein
MEMGDRFGLRQNAARVVHARPGEGHRPFDWCAGAGYDVSAAAGAFGEPADCRSIWRTSPLSEGPILIQRLHLIRGN